MEESKEFVYRGKNWFLTYPQVKLKLNVFQEKLFEHFRGIGLTIVKYIVAREKHADGNPHFHCYLGLAAEVRTKRAAGWFDVEGFVANCQVVRSIDRVIGYCAKDGMAVSKKTGKPKKRYSTNIQSEVDKALARRETDARRAQKEAIARDLMEGKHIKIVVKENPLLLFGLRNLVSDVRTWKALTVRVQGKPGYRGIWLVGPSKAGKTSMSRSRFGNVYVKTFDKWFCGYDDEEYDGIVFDDLSLCQDHAYTFWMLKEYAHCFTFKGQGKGEPVRDLDPGFVMVTSNFSRDQACDYFGVGLGVEREPWLNRFMEFEIKCWTDVINCPFLGGVGRGLDKC